MELLQLVGDHVHYIPPEWIRDPRSSKTQKYFSQLFQVRRTRHTLTYDIYVFFIFR